jgi:hypothetical protein
MRRIPPKSFALLVLLLLGVGGATAQLTVNIDVSIGFVPTYSGQGAYSDPGNDYWNGITSTAGGSNFLASDGVTATTLSFSVAGIDSGQIGYGGTPANAGGLLADYFYVTGTTPATFTLGGLTPGHSYDVYLYSQAGSSYSTDRLATLTFGSSSQNLTAYTVGSFVEGTNYVVFHVTPDGTSVSGSFVGNLGGNEAELNGLQVVDHGVAVPEPSTYAALAGLAALGLAATRHGRLPARGV